jgi:3-oxoadipate enol-lactonase/4-carboxymuconolactone decarboxylase
VEQPAAVTDLLVRHFSTAWLSGAEGPGAPAPSGVTQSVSRPRAMPIAELAPAPGRSGAGDRDGLYDTGLKVRREVLGDAFVDRALDGADDFSGDFQQFATRYAWGEVWDRPGLDRRSRSCVALGALVAGGHWEEFAAHTRGALRNGLTPDEIREVLLQTALHCGLPAADRAFAIAQQVVREETMPQE